MKLCPGVESSIDEFVDFAGIDDTHDDQVDWTSGAYMLLFGKTGLDLEVLGQYEMG